MSYSSYNGNSLDIEDSHNLSGMYHGEGQQQDAERKYSVKFWSAGILMAEEKVWADNEIEAKELARYSTGLFSPITYKAEVSWIGG